MKLALIAPTNLLDKYAVHSDGVHLVLAATVLRDPAYAEWYRKRAMAGDIVILDNMAYEKGEPITMLEIIEAANRVDATTVVAPDFPGRHWRATYDSYRSFRDQLPDKFQVFGCPQSADGDIEGLVTCFNSMAEDSERLSHIGVSILACPNAAHYVTGTRDIEANRFFMTCILRDQGMAKDYLNDRGIKLHYLGLGEQNLDLIQYYRGYADSLDTKGPVKSGLFGHRLSGGTLNRGMGAKLDLCADWEVTQEIDERILFNIAALKSLMQGGLK